MPEPITIAALLGSLVGLVLGLTGAGGGILAVPALMLGLGMNLTDATPISLVAIGGAASLGALDGLANGQVRYRAALFMAALGMASAPLGVWLAHRLPQSLLVTIFCGVMAVIALRMLRPPPRGGAGEAAGHPGARNCALNPATGCFRWNTPCAVTLACMGAAAGLFTGLLGVGGGFLIVPALRQFSDLTMAAAAATSLAVIALVSTSTVIGSLLHGGRIGPTGWAFIAATGAGLLLARHFARHIPDRLLQRGFGWIVVLVAMAWLGQSLG